MPNYRHVPEKLQTQKEWQMAPVQLSSHTLIQMVFFLFNHYCDQWKVDSDVDENKFQH